MHAIAVVQQLSTAANRPVGSTGYRTMFRSLMPLPSKITYIKMDPLRSIRNGFVHGDAVMVGGMF